MTDGFMNTLAKPGSRIDGVISGLRPALMRHAQLVLKRDDRASECVEKCIKLGLEKMRAAGISNVHMARFFFYQELVFMLDELCERCKIQWALQSALLLSAEGFSIYLVAKIQNISLNQVKDNVRTILNESGSELSSDFQMHREALARLNLPSA